MKKTLIVLCVPLVVLMSAGVIYRFFYEKMYQIVEKNSIFQLKRVKISGQIKIKEEEILNYLNLSPHEQLHQVNLEVMRQTLLRHPRLKTVEIKRRYPSTLDIRVQEHIPAGLVAIGGLYLVDEHGEIFSKTSVQDAPDFPVMLGLSRELYESNRLLWKELMQLGFNFIKEAQKQQVLLLDVQLDPDLGVSAHLAPESTLASFGKNDFDRKLSQLTKIRTLLNIKNQKAQYYLLDNMRHPEWVVVRLQETTHQQKKPGVTKQSMTLAKAR